MAGYLPRESESSLLSKNILASVWTSKLIARSLGSRNENEAREWFRTHPEVHVHFYQMECELKAKIEELQQRAYNGLTDIVVRERGDTAGFIYNDVNYKKEH